MFENLILQCAVFFYRTVGMRGIETKKLVPGENFTLKNDVDLQLMTELWSEPLAVTDAQSVALAESLHQQVIEK